MVFKRLKKLQVVHSDVWRLVEENARILAGVELLIKSPETKQLN